MQKRQRKRERAVLVGIELPDQTMMSLEDSLAELERLVIAAGGETIGRFYQSRPKPDGRFYIGKGKAQEVAEFAAKEKADLLVFDDEISPQQQRHLEEIFKIKIIDRSKLILDIFASRAKTREAKLEVELAQLEYLLPRLTRMWEFFSRLGGGIGTRGPGETQLEIDRRRVREKISHLKKKIKEVSEHRALLRSGRRSKGYELISLVGYTNAGKSTLLNTLAHENVYVADKPFATLDPVTRQVYLPGLKRKALFFDTVGFIQKLPHTLIDSFKATLEEVNHANILLHVVDVSSSNAKQQIEAVYRVLEELGAMTKPIVTVLNKIDEVVDKEWVESLKRTYYPAVEVSALKRTGITELIKMTEEVLSSEGKKI
ncbi:GTPase HflX [Candidatus Margulisiibacteriota bacterium]